MFAEPFTPMSYITKITADKSTLWKNTKLLLPDLDMELTERCNNNCIHCCINLPPDDHKAQAKELTTEEIQDILLQAVSLGCMTVQYTGGEALLRDDFEDLYLFARKLGLKVLLFTNATLITPALADLFARIPPLKRIEITLYGMKRRSYEAITRVPGSFEAAWRGIHLLLERNIPFIVKSVLLPPNKDEIEEFEAWAATLPYMDTKPSYSMFYDLRSRRDSEKKNKRIRKLRLAQEEGIRFLTRNAEKYRLGMKEFCDKFMGPGGEELFTCGAGLGGCVDAYGNYLPCMLLKHPDMAYSLRTTPDQQPITPSLRDALTRFFPELRKMKATNQAYLARCAQCILKGLCEQCPAKSWSEHGDLDTPVEYLCEIAHAKAEYLGLLNEGEKGWETDLD